MHAEYDFAYIVGFGLGVPLISFFRSITLRSLSMATFGTDARSMPQISGSAAQTRSVGEIRSDALSAGILTLYSARLNTAGLSFESGNVK